MMLKKVVSIILSAVLCLGLSCIALAASTSAVITPYYVSINDAYNEVSFSGKTAIVYAEVTCTSDVTKINITSELQKKPGSSWSAVAQFTKTFYDNDASMESTYSPASSGTYRVKTTYKATSSKGTETHTRTSLSATY